MKVFIAGGPRNGTTLCSHIIAALGFSSYAKILDYANAEDNFLHSLTDELGFKYRKSAISHYFQEFNSFNLSHNVFLKHPLLISSPRIRPHIRMKDQRDNYCFMAREFLQTFDVIIYVERDSLRCFESEFRYLSDLSAANNIQLAKVDEFKSDYLSAHENTFATLSEVAASMNVEHKLHPIRYEDILDNPVQVLSDLGKRLDVSVNQMVESVISKTMLSSEKGKRQPPEVYSLLCTLLGQINNYFNELNSSQISYSDYTAKLAKLQSIISLL